MRYILVLLASTLLIGCAKINSIRHEFQVDERPKVAIVDAKQRVIAIHPNLPGRYVNGARPMPGEPALHNRTGVCVEQSPDVFSFFSGAFGISAEGKQAAAALAAALAESGGSLAFRTQVTQAQTSLLFAICQMYANGALSDRAVRAELRRFQHTLLGILAIEQLTSPNRMMPTQQIMTTSAAEVGRNVELAQSRVNQLEQDRDRLRQERNDAQSASEINRPAENAEESAEQKDLREKYEAKKRELDTAEANLELARQQLRSARLALDISASGAQASTINVYAPQSSGIESHVASAVVDSIEKVLFRGVILDNCIESIFEDRIVTSGNFIEEICKSAIDTYMDVYKKMAEARIEIAKKHADIVQLYYSSLDGIVDIGVPFGGGVDTTPSPGSNLYPVPMYRLPEIKLE